MKGLLKEKSEIEKLQKEFKLLSELSSKKKMPKETVPQEELILDECES